MISISEVKCDSFDYVTVMSPTGIRSRYEKRMKSSLKNDPYLGFITSKVQKLIFCYLDVINPVCGTLFMDDFMRFSTLGRKFAYFVRGTASSNIIIHIFDKYGESERCKVVGISE